VHNPGSRHDGYSASAFSSSADEVTCQQFVELITDYFEGALSPPTHSRVEEHLLMCDWCVTYADQIEATAGALHELKDHEAAEPSDALLTALHARYQA
jgi:predicted anti-sigma-YlaC factor YlaD